MPVLPEIVSERSTMVGGIDVYADGNAFGAQIGSAVQGLGNAIQNVGEQFMQEKRRQEAENRDTTVSTATADATIAWSKQQIEDQQNAPADPEGFADNRLQKLREDIETRAAQIKDPKAATQFKKTMYGRMVEYYQSDAKFELGQGQLNREMQVGEKLDGLENSIRVNGNAYNQIWTEGNALIESQRDMPVLAKNALKRQWKERTTFARFNSLLDNASSTHDFDAIQKDLERDVFKEALSPEQVNKLANEVQSARRTFSTQASTAASAALTAMDERIKKGESIPLDELQSAQKLVMDSENATLMRRLAETSAYSTVNERYKDKSAAQINAAANGVMADGFGLPDVINKSVQEATTKFPGVPADFVAGTVSREYGPYFPKREINRKFAPQSANKGIILDKLQPGTYNAVSRAGEIFGRPLLVTSGYRSEAKQRALRYAKGKNPFRATIAKDSQHTHGSAVDISTAGMSETEKAKLFSSLLQAGFTAFGDYGKSGYIHADMRPNAPKSVGGTWLGWTNTSPEVMAALTQRGYKAGASSASVQRDPVPDEQAIDYGLGPIGGGTSARGVGQFLDDTWIDVVSDPGVRQRVGIPENLTRAQLLDLRKDPRLSTLIIAANGEKNNKALSRVLGRDLDAPELYMAHFLGTGGASAIFAAYKNAPDTLAKDVLPDAASKNKGAFYKNERPVTVKEFYDNIQIEFARSPTQRQMGMHEHLKAMGDQRRKAETEDTMTHYSRSVLQSQGPNDLSEPGGFRARAPYLQAAADLYDLSITDAKPFTSQEADQLKKIFSEGGVNEKLAVMRDILTMDTGAKGATQAALNQLGLKDTVPAFAAERAMSSGEMNVAEEIMRGDEKLRGKDGKADTNFARGIFGDATQRDNTASIFQDEVGGMIFQMGDDTHRAAYAAARAIYVERFSRGSATFNEDQFREAARIAVNATEDRTFEFNDKEVIVPPGISADDVETVVNNLQDADLITLSKTEAPPVDFIDNPVLPEDIRDYGQLEYIGGYSYRVLMTTDNAYLTTGRMMDNGMLEPYIMEFKPEVVDTLAKRPKDSSDYVPNIPESEAGLGGGSVVTDEQRRKLFGADTIMGQ